MRRLIGLSLGIMFLAACGEMRESNPLDVAPEGGPTFTTTNQIQIGDGASGTQEGNPHFFFLPPVAEDTPETGTPDGDLEPIVTLCHVMVENGVETCPELTTFTKEPNAEGKSLSVSDVGVYSVVWQSNVYPVTDLEVYKITVSLMLPSAVLSSGSPGGEELTLGWALTKAYDNQTYSSFQHTDGDGYIAISDNGNLNIKFIIDEDLLESEFCDVNNLEDCDVALFNPQENGCLTVYENPGQTGQLPGSVACVPANGNPTVEGTPVTGPYAVVLTLEKPEVTSQGGAFAPAYQKPYFPDVSTWPHGIVFDSESDGLLITICQQESEFEALEMEYGVEGLLFQARPFLVFSDGTGTRTFVPTLSEDNILEEGEYLFDPTACHDEEPVVTAMASPSGPEGLLGYLAAGVSRVTNLVRPRPLVARRLHGGLNTKTYGTSPSGGGDAVAAFDGEAGVPLEGEEYEIGGGAVLDVNIDASEVSIDPEEGLMLEPSTITVTPRNALGEVIPFDVTVTVWVEGANEGAEVTITETTDGNGNTIYEATYTPQVSGDDIIHVAIDGVEFPGGFGYYVAPLSGVIEVYVEIDDSTIPAGDPDPAVGLPVVLYDASGGELERQVTQSTGSRGVGLATFGSEESGDYLFGDYTVALPKRDFDFAFEKDSNGDEIYEQDVTHSADPTIVTFSGSLMDLPDGMHVYRIGAGMEGAGLYPGPFGTGNVYQYVEDTRSWVSAQNQIQYLSLADAYEDVPAHMVTITTAGENAFAASLVIAQCSGETDTKQCKSRGWIGLTDEETDDSFEWVNNEGYLNPCAPSNPRPSDPFFFGWADKEPSGRNNEDQVEIDLAGKWFDENGASSTNDGYITEFKAWQPQEDPPLTCSGS
jgi:hypothetical protein